MVGPSSSPRRRHRPAALLVWLVAVLSAGPTGRATARSDAIDAVMTALAAVREIDATFQEEKTLAILEQALVSTGTMRYRAPNELVLAIEDPQPETFRFEWERLTIATPGQGERQVPLAGDPPLQMLVQTVLATFAGDLAALRQRYRVEFSGEPARWLLRLVPNDPEVARYVEAILIDGRDNWVRTVERREIGGDRIVTTFTPLRIE
jgi:hypothetical protein